MTSIQLTVWKDMFNIIWTKNKDSDGVTVTVYNGDGVTM
jgi:hypothetical protein